MGVVNGFQRPIASVFKNEEVALTFVDSAQLQTFDKIDESAFTDCWTYESAFVAFSSLTTSSLAILNSAITVFPAFVLSPIFTLTSASKGK